MRHTDTRGEVAPFPVFAGRGTRAAASERRSGRALARPDVHGMAVAVGRHVLHGWCVLWMSGLAKGSTRPTSRCGTRQRLAGSRMTEVGALAIAFLLTTPLPALAAEDPIRALILPQRHATLASRLQATIDDIGPDNGERFRAGDVLVAFDCTGFMAELARADAAAEAARDTVRVKEELARSGSGSKLQASVARSEARRAAAEVTVTRNQVDQCSIRAPYAGRVVKRIANAHETVGFRDPLLEIVDDSSVEVRAFVPSAWGPELPVGTRFSVRVDETGAEIDAEVVAQAAWIDNISQLMEVRGKVLAGAENLTAGMSGTACFATVAKSTGGEGCSAVPLPEEAPSAEAPPAAAPGTLRLTPSVELPSAPAAGEQSGKGLTAAKGPAP
jgi:membrane fusion protein, multidrug efflux system